MISTGAKLVLWIQEEMAKIGATKAVVGISGGKDSSVVAALMAKAIGKDNVYGVLMPNGEQTDIDYAKELCQHLEIKHKILNINEAHKAYMALLAEAQGDWYEDISRETKLNLPPRLRMSLLYAVAQSLHAVVINTSNLSEDWVGYATVYGDTTGAFSPLGQLTTDEVIALGELLGLPEKFLIKPPSDGLTGKTDEEILGFSYPVLNKYIREGICEDEVVKAKIDRLHKISRFKFLPIPMFPSQFPIKAEDIASIYKK